jgi:hypothetical protein
LSLVIQQSNQNYIYLKINITVAVNVIPIILIITTTLFLLSSLSVLPSIRAEMSNLAIIDNLSDSLSKTSTLSMPVLESPSFNYTESDISSSPKPVMVNGTHELVATFTGYGTINGIQVKDTGTAYLVSQGNDSVYTFGNGTLASKEGHGTLIYTFHSVGHYHQGGNFQYIGVIFDSNPTGSLSFLSNTIGIYKGWYDKSGNGMSKTWFWKG